MKKPIMERPNEPMVKIDVSGDDDTRVAAIYQEIMNAISGLNQPGTVLLTRKQKYAKPF